MADVVISPQDIVLTESNQSQYVRFGEQVIPGDVVYLDTVNNKMMKADNTTVEKALAVGIALTYTNADGYGYMFTGGGQSIDLGVSFTEGEMYVVSTNAGKIMPYSDLVIGGYFSILGFGNADSNLNWQTNATGLTKTV